MSRAQKGCKGPLLEAKGKLEVKTLVSNFADKINETLVSKGASALCLGGRRTSPLRASLSMSDKTSL